MNDISWELNTVEETNLIGFYKGKKIEILKDFNGKWQVLFNGTRFQDGYGFISRAEAKKWIEEVDIFDQLCNVLSKI